MAYNNGRENRKVVDEQETTQETEKTAEASEPDISDITDELPTEKETITPTPVFIKPKSNSRIQIFDLHPEIPQSDRHNFRITDDALGAGSVKEKFRKNVEAIKTLQTIDIDNRYATKPWAEHPFIVAVTEGEAAVSLSAEEHKILADYFNLYVEMTNLERQQIYFRGHTDSFAYLKKIGVI